MAGRLVPQGKKFPANPFTKGAETLTPEDGFQLFPARCGRKGNVAHYFETGPLPENSGPRPARIYPQVYVGAGG